MANLPSLATNHSLKGTAQADTNTAGHALFQGNLAFNALLHSQLGQSLHHNGRAADFDMTIITQQAAFVNSRRGIFLTPTARDIIYHLTNPC